MPRGKTPTVDLEEAKARFEKWRQNRRGKGRIPAELWSAAVAVARKEGLNRTARELHVAWDDLKRRMAITREVPRKWLCVRRSGCHRTTGAMPPLWLRNMIVGPMAGKDRLRPDKTVAVQCPQDADLRKRNWQTFSASHEER